MKRLAFFLIIAVLGLLFPPTVSSQTVLSGVAGSPADSVDLFVNPENPGANQQITVTVSSFAYDLNTATVSWMVNGKSLGREVGLKNIEFITGSLGQVANITVAINTNQGLVINKSLTIRPAEVDLLWEAVSYTPAFYKGKGLFAHQSQADVVAIPHLLNSSGNKIPVSQLNFSWQNNGRNLPEVSGVGKNIYRFIDPIISRPAKIEVLVTNVAGTVQASNNTTITPVEPLVLFYQNHPLYGIDLARPLGSNLQLNQGEVEIVAVPYFFGTKLKYSRVLDYDWSVNNQSSADQANRRSVIFRAPTGGSGSSLVSLTIKNIVSSLQSADTGVRFDFSNTQANENAF